ncbi:Malonyl-CoA:anthocyanidin 5-O-glucoside-6''-O-malonyltransferase [Citrus sinensis]|uniref:Malonyl-CoA:anthocyanidin 5-O-glucoside-6''-O-malonyltransferase n=2 Tax=Citrus sinensis TaxID=2711 RepID=A0ACB8M2F1_CITSI|nr:Malonyl-CoA:anthocyanidin 5-O-glucoside-6''-O-malonyltransferase [Citrus sinensis]
MAEKHSVKIHSVSKISPPSSDSVIASTLPLTYFDTLWLKFPPSERLFFYQITDLTFDLFNSVILPKLADSLSLTLLHYLPLAGHIMWPADSAKPAIYYFPDQNDGISFTVAESDADFSHLSGNNGNREAVEFHHLAPQLSISDDKAEVVAIQITLFPKQGFCISVLTHHAVIDGKSKTMFERSWAYFCKQLIQMQQQNLNNSSILLPTELIPCFDRTLIKDRKGLDVVYANHWLAFQSDKRSLKLVSMSVLKAHSSMVRKSFELTREDIKKLRDKVQGNEVLIRQAKELHLSSYVLTCAYVYVCLVKAMGVEGDATVMLRVAANCRSRLDPPLPVNYFGNCVSAHGTPAKASDVVDPENGIAFVADKLSDLVKGLKREVIEGSEEKILNLLKYVKEGGGQAPGRLLGVAGSNRFDVYGSDFGWGKPKRVEIILDRAISNYLVESRNGGGAVEVGVVLEKPQMEAFSSLFVNGLN